MRIYEEVLENVEKYAKRVVNVRNYIEIYKTVSKYHLIF